MPLTALPLLPWTKKIRQRIRFALPTVDIFRAFAPTASSASLVECSEFCAQMLQWPFCRGLLLTSKSLAVPIHGSQEQLSVVLRATEKMQSFFLSWADAASLLEEDGYSFSMPDLTASRADGGSTESRLLNIKRALEKLLQGQCLDSTHDVATSSDDSPSEPDTRCSFGPVCLYFSLAGASPSRRAGSLLLVRSSYHGAGSYCPGSGRGASPPSRRVPAFGVLLLAQDSVLRRPKTPASRGSAFASRGESSSRGSGLDEFRC